MRAPVIDERDAAMVAERMAKLRERKGPQVGDFVRFNDGTMRRISYCWDDGCQTSDGGSFYLSDAGWCSFSGGLYPSVPTAELRDTGETAEGSVWIFHHDYWTAGNGVQSMEAFRVWEIDRKPNR